ncbi:hypothetical protein SAMN05421676_101150 [Salinibacillus kushneri]|uniref:Serine/threonine protein kinase n=1 Tax=Salinibacillus kushneri TaxID=237682 RepID=A0A1H9YFF0_9BACI|nr:serine/threonine protein kinase [Salinibacillus kushneri]SES67750.1 hypothetical protein SAMN05421676_101150 [Salinibacillus kushneri]
MKDISELVEAVKFYKTKIRSYPDDLIFVGKGRSAVVFRIAHTQWAVKIFYPAYEYLAQQEVSIYNELDNSRFFPEIYEEGANYFVLTFLSGVTFYDCLRKGIEITPEMVKQVDEALEYTKMKGLNPTDTHLKNIILTNDGSIKLIDVARFKQEKECNQWEDLKASYKKFYQLRYFPKKFPKIILEMIIRLYRYNLLPQSLF